MTDWLGDLALGADGPPWLSMGVGRVDEAGWLAPDEHRTEELTLRHRLLAECHDEVFAALPGTEAAGAEVERLVRAWLGEHRPDLAVPVAPEAAHPLERAGRLVQEDLVLMVPRDGAHHLDGACLCFPSHWRLADKLGRPAAGIHGPVPRYAEELADRVDRYLDRLRPGPISLRRNWSVHDSSTLFAPEPPAAPATLTDPAAVPSSLWLRSERQTLRRLPETGAVLFTIRVQQAPFGVLAERSDVAARFAARLRAQPADLTEMNGIAPHLPAVLAWLDQVAR